MLVLRSEQLLCWVGKVAETALVLISRKAECRGARVATSVVLRPLLGTISEAEAT